MKSLRLLGNFFSLHIQNQKDPHKTSFSELLLRLLSFLTVIKEKQGKKSYYPHAF